MYTVYICYRLRTRDVSWGFLATRMSAVPEGLSTNIPPLITEWATYSQGDMTWEGHEWPLNGSVSIDFIRFLGIKLMMLMK